MCWRLGPSIARHTFIQTVPAHLTRRACVLILARRAMNSPLIKKAGKYFIFTGIFKPIEYDDHDI
jgi:hypothetical protein